MEGFKRTIWGAVSAATVFWTSQAGAHIRLDYPAARVMGSEDGPCGVADSVRSSTPTQLMGGEELTVEWTETIDHSGNFRISLLLDGDGFEIPMSQNDNCDPAFDDWCIADGLPDQVAEGGLPNEYTYTLTLPNVDCENCTLQVVQKTFINYFQCADISIVSQGDVPPIDGTGGDASGTGGTDAGTGGADAGTGGADAGTGGADAGTGGAADLVPPTGGTGGSDPLSTGGEPAVDPTMMPEGAPTEGGDGGTDSDSSDSGGCAANYGAQPRPSSSVLWGLLLAMLGLAFVRRRGT